MKNRHPLVRRLAVFASSIAFVALPLHAASPGAGEIAIYTEAVGGEAITTTDYTHDFDGGPREDIGTFSRTGGSITLKRAGHYLAIYNSRFDGPISPANSNARVEIQSYLKLNTANLPIGWSQGFIRRQETQDETITAGVAVFEANANDILQLHSIRTDSTGVGTVTRVANATGIQLLKLDDDNMSFAKLSLATGATGPTTSTWVAVPYDTDDLDPGFTHGAAGDLTLVEGGKYLVTANTYANGPTDRTALVQRLSLDDVLVPGTKTTVYLRGTGYQSTEEGAAAIGAIIEAAPGQVLNVEGLLDVNRTTNYVGGRCALTVVKIPDTSDYLRVSNTADQDVNKAADTALTFANNIEVDSLSFAHAAAASKVTAQQAGDYLFLSTLYDDNDQVMRGFYSQGWWINGSPREIYGHSGRYSRSTQGADQFGNTSGLIASGLVVNDTVEMVSMALGKDGVNYANQIFLQGVRIGSLFGGVDVSPQAVAVTEGGAATTYSLGLQVDPVGGVDITVTADADTEVSTNGTTFFGSVVLSFSDTTPETVHVRAIDNGVLEGAQTSTITHAVTATLDSFGYPLTMLIADLSVDIMDDDVIPVVAVDDASTVALDENTATNEAIIAPQATLLANDTDGFSNFVSAFDSTSANGAAVTVTGTGTFTYDPTGSATLQALDDGESVVDTFTYTAEDANGNTDVGTVSITVDGVNDDPVVAAESVTRQFGNPVLNLLSNDSDVDGSDVLTVSNFDTAGTGGPVPTTVFNGQFVPLVFTSAQGATVTVSADGSFEYDVSTSTAILGLADGATLVETFSYDVFDGTSTIATSITITSIGTVGATDDIAAVAANATVNFNALTNDSVYGGAVGTPTANPELQFVQGTAGNLETTWIQDGAASLASVTLDNGGTESLLDLAITNPPAGFSSAYALSGTNSGAPHSNFGVAELGDFDTLDVSFELVFRPSDRTGREVLWEGGGNGNGTSIVLIDDKIVLSESDGLPELAQVVATLPPGAVAGGEFVHMVGLVDLTGNAVSLYVNGVLVASAGAINENTGAAADITDLSGTDLGGLGRFQGTIAGENFAGNFGTIRTDGYGPFSGELAVARVYESLLTPTQVMDNYQAIVGGTVGTAVAGDVVELNGNASPIPGTTVETLASGATVTFETDGTFTYDPSGAFDSLALGFTATDSFTYKLNTHNSSTATARVVVTGTNANPQITIAADQPSGVTEGASATFTISASGAGASGAVVDLSYTGTASDGADYTSTAQVTFSGASTTLSLPTFADGIFEPGVNNIVVTVDSVNGAHVVGSPAAAETFILDADSAPVFTIVRDAASFAEGAEAGFTITSSAGIEGDVTVSLAYSGGTATADQDYIRIRSAILPASIFPTVNTTIDLDVPLCEDGVAEGAESFSVSLDSVSSGTIGTPSFDSVEISDGAGSIVFDANFEGVTTSPSTGVNAPVAADEGTSVGSWSNIPLGTEGGSVPGVIVETDDPKGDGVDFQLRVDRPSPAGTTPPLVYTDVTANFEAPIDLSGSNTGVISFDLGQIRSETGSKDKSSFITGYDAAGNKSFELYLDAQRSTDERLYHVDSTGLVFTPLGSVQDFEYTQVNGNSEAAMSHVKLVMNAAGFSVAIDKFAIDGVFESFEGPFAYAGPATQISKLVFAISTSTDTKDSGGIIMDDVQAVGIRANQPPALTLDGANLANGGSTGLPNQPTATAIIFDAANNLQLQVADADAASGTMTLRLEAVNSLGTISVSLLAGSATAPASGTDDVLITGNLADINATLANGVAYNAGAGAGAEILRLTVDDGGNTGAPAGNLNATHDLTFALVADPLVTIEQSAGQADPALEAPVVFDVVFSETVQGFDDGSTDVVLSGSAGATTAVISGSGATYTVSVTGMAQTGTVIASIPAGAAQRPVTLEDNVASTSADNTVDFVLNVPPVATNLSQTLVAATAGAGDMVPLDDIAVSDANNLSASVIGAAANPLFSYDGLTNVTTFDGGSPGPFGQTFTLPQPSVGAGFAYELRFTPTAADLAAGGAGTENRRAVFEGGGTTNGNGLYLVEGSLQFIVKMNGTSSNVFTGPLNDTSWDSGTSDDVIAVEIANSLTAGEEASLALVFDSDSVRYSINGGAEVNLALTDRGSRSDWSGNESLSIGVAGGAGGGLAVNGTGGIYDESSFTGLDNNVTSFKWWNGSGPTFPIGSFEEITVELEVDPYVDDATSGSLSATSGNGESYSAGTWSITGTIGAVNAALADVKYTFGSGGAPVTISISVADGGENGSSALNGGIAIIESGANTGLVYVDDGSFGGVLPGTAIADADGGSPSSSATFGIDAFATLADAFAAVAPTGTIVVNDGDYSGESLVLTGTYSLRLTDAGDAVAIGSLDAEFTNTLDIQNSHLTLGDATGSSIIDCPISGTSGTLTKTGADDLRLRGASTFTGVTTINEGRIVITYRDAANRGSLASSGITVTNPGILALGALVDTTYTHSNPISGTGSVSTFENGTVIFNTPGGNSFSGGFDLGDGPSSLFDGTTGPKEGFVVLNDSDDLGTGKILSRGGQLQAGSLGIVIPNDIDITAGGFRNGGAIDFAFSGNIATIDGAPRGFGNYGLEGLDLTISGNISNAGGNVQFEGSDTKDNGTWTVTGDISGPNEVIVHPSFDNGMVTLSGPGTNAYSGGTQVQAGTLVYDTTHTGGSAYTVASGATLAGSGSTDAVVTVNAGGTLSPGASVGAIALGGLILNGDLLIEINDVGAGGSDYDQVVVNGAVDLGSGTLITASATGSPVDFTSGGALVIIDNDDIDGDSIVGAFGNLATGAVIGSDFLGSGRSADIDYDNVGDNDVTINVGAVFSVIGQWRDDNYGTSVNAGPAANDSDAGDGDGLVNLVEFACGCDPLVSNGGVVVNGPGDITVGAPAVWIDPADDRVYLRYSRRTDYASEMLSYTEQFSADDLNFESGDDVLDSSLVPVTTDTTPDGVEVEVVDVEFPGTLSVSGRKARFSRIDVTNTP